MEVILASESKRRKILLKMILSNFGLKFSIKPANIAEYIPKNCKNFPHLVRKLSKEKVKYISQKSNGVIIGADTIVVYGGKVMGKPKDKADAEKMLKILSGNIHKVYTGLTILDKNICLQDYEVTKVRFRKLEENEIKYYINTNSPMDKAGAYGIQDDFGSTFVECIDGDYFNVVGLPVVKTYLLLKKVLENYNIVL